MKAYKWIRVGKVELFARGDGVRVMHELMQAACLLSARQNNEEKSNWNVALKSVGLEFEFPECRSKNSSERNVATDQPRPQQPRSTGLARPTLPGDPDGVNKWFWREQSGLWVEGTCSVWNGMVADRACHCRPTFCTRFAGDCSRDAFWFCDGRRQATYASND